MNLLKRFLGNEIGTTAIQYALVAGVLSLAVLTGSLALRGSIIGLYDDVADEASNALVNDASGEGDG